MELVDERGGKYNITKAESMQLSKTTQKCPIFFFSLVSSLFPKTNRMLIIPLFFINYEIAGSLVKRPKTFYFTVTWLNFSVQYITCGKPASPKNGMIIGEDFGFDGVIRFECDTGYDLSGGDVSVCQSNGSWSGSLPSCTSWSSC